MRTIALLVSSLGILVSASSQAEVREIPLPGLLGDYGVKSELIRTATVELAQPPAVVHGVSLRIRGVTVAGATTCYFNPPPTTYPLVMSFDALVSEGARHWYASGPPSSEAGAFGWTEQFVLFLGSDTGSFLLDGKADVSLGAYNLDSPIPECLTEYTPTGTIEEAVLVVDAEFPVPALPASWGRIKSQYR